LSYRFKLRPPHNIGGGTHFSGGTNPDSGGTFVSQFKLLKYALPRRECALCNYKLYNRFCNVGLRCFLLLSSSQPKQ